MVNAAASEAFSLILFSPFYQDFVQWYISKSTLNKLQYVQNLGARILTAWVQDIQSYHSSFGLTLAPSRNCWISIPQIIDCDLHNPTCWLFLVNS